MSNASSTPSKEEPRVCLVAGDGGTGPCERHSDLLSARGLQVTAGEESGPFDLAVATSWAAALGPLLRLDADARGIYLDDEEALRSGDMRALFIDKLLGSPLHVLTPSPWLAEQVAERHRKTACLIPSWDTPARAADALAAGLREAARQPVDASELARYAGCLEDYQALLAASESMTAEQDRLRGEVRVLEGSRSYRLGRAVLWPLRMLGVDPDGSVAAP